MTLKIAYTAAAAVDIDPEASASSATFVAGAESAAVSNSINLFDDVLLSGLITVGTTPTVDTQIQIWIVAARNETPTWPDVMDGTKSKPETWTSVGIRNGAAELLHTLTVDATTSDRGYEFSGKSVAALFDGVMPDDWLVWITHNTGVNLNATAGNQIIEYIGIHYADV